MSALTGFNNVLIRFLEKIMKWYPELGDLRLIYRGVETLKKYNPRMVLDQFLFYVGPYYLEIFNKQEQFFTDLNNLMKDPNIQDVIKSESNIDELNPTNNIDKSKNEESNPTNQNGTNQNGTNNNGTNNNGTDNNESIFQRIVVFKDVYERMDEERKAYVWKMFAALLKVGALASNEEAYKVILNYVQEHPEL